MSAPDRPSPADFGGRSRRQAGGFTRVSREPQTVREYPGCEEIPEATVLRHFRGDGKAYKRLHLTVSAGLVEQIEAAAEADGKSVSRYLKDIIAWRVGV